MDGYLILADGKSFKGELNREIEDTLCRLVVNTSTSGHAELLQNPALFDQGLVLTFPEVGNRGLSALEAKEKPLVKALIVRHLYRGVPEDADGEDWNSYCEQNGLIVLSGIDTRSLAAYIRENDIANALICSNHPTNFSDIRDEIINYQPAGPVRREANAVIYSRGDEETSATELLAVLDYGAGQAWLDRLLDLGYRLTVFQPDSDPSKIFSEKPAALILSDGPAAYLGDETAEQQLEAVLTTARANRCPVVGIGLGHLLLAKSQGLRITPLPAGKGNSVKPIVRQFDGKILQAAIRASYAVDPDSLTDRAAVLFRQLNDANLAGIVYDEGLFKGYSFDPTTLVEPGVSQAETTAAFFMGQ